jgi:hypothetical protein
VRPCAASFPNILGRADRVLNNVDEVLSRVDGTLGRVDGTLGDVSGTLSTWRDPYGTHYLVDHTGTRRLNAA